MSTADIPTTAPNKREALRALLADGQWHHMSELRAVGGWRYGARLLEIRQEHGVTIENRAIGDGEFEYRLSFNAQAVLPLGPPKKKGARARIEELARENAELKRRIEQLHREAKAEGAPAHG